MHNKNTGLWVLTMPIHAMSLQICIAHQIAMNEKKTAQNICQFSVVFGMKRIKFVWFHGYGSCICLHGRSLNNFLEKSSSKIHLVHINNCSEIDLGSII